MCGDAVGCRVRDGGVADVELDTVDYCCTWTAQARDGARRRRSNVFPASLCLVGTAITSTTRSCHDSDYGSDENVHI